MFFDPLYLLFAAPGLLLGLWAQWRVKSTFSSHSRIPNTRGLSGAEVARNILHSENIHDVQIERSDGFLSDHYSPGEKALRLSPDVFEGRSIAACGVAAHEVGHAIQHARGYRWLGLRSALVPAMQLASPMAVPAIVIGFLLSSFVGWLGQGIAALGIVLFGMVLLFQLVTLPVEFDASARALRTLENNRILANNELQGARKVLNAAAWTYVAAAISSLLTLLYFLLRFGAMGRRS